METALFDYRYSGNFINFLRNQSFLHTSRAVARIFERWRQTKLNVDCTVWTKKDQKDGASKVRAWAMAPACTVVLIGWLDITWKMRPRRITRRTDVSPKHHWPQTIPSQNGYTVLWGFCRTASEIQLSDANMNNFLCRILNCGSEWVTAVWLSFTPRCIWPGVCIFAYTSVDHIWYG